MSPMPAEVAAIRRGCCAQAGCPHTPDYDDPCAACPGGHWGQWTRDCAPPAPAPASLLQRLQLGTLVERAVKPLAKALGLPCLEKDGTLKPQSPCAARRDRLNGRP